MARAGYFRPFGVYPERSQRPFRTMKSTLLLTGPFPNLLRDCALQGNPTFVSIRYTVHERAFFLMTHFRPLPVTTVSMMGEPFAGGSSTVMVTFDNDLVCFVETMRTMVTRPGTFALAADTVVAPTEVTAQTAPTATQAILRFISLNPFRLYWRYWFQR